MSDEELRQRLLHGMRQALLGQGTYAPGERTMRRRLDALLPVVEDYADRRVTAALREAIMDLSVAHAPDQVEDWIERWSERADGDREHQRWTP